MEKQTTFYTIKLLKQISENRRKIAKLFIKKPSTDFKSCGKGILKIFKSEKKKLIEIKNFKNFPKNFQNLFLLIDNKEILDNKPIELKNAKNFENILKTNILKNKNVIFFFDLNFGSQIEKNDKDKILRFFDNNGNEIGIAFNDLVEFYNIYKFICLFKGKEFSPIIENIDFENIDVVLDKILNSKDECGFYLNFFEHDLEYLRNVFGKIKIGLENKNLQFLTKIFRIFTTLLKFANKPDLLIKFCSEEFFKIFFELAKIENDQRKIKIQNFLTIQHLNFFPISDSEILKQINTNYRIIFLKDILYSNFFSNSQKLEIGGYLKINSEIIAFYINQNSEQIFEYFHWNFEKNPEIAFKFFEEIHFFFKSYCSEETNLKFLNKFFDFKCHYKILNKIFRYLEYNFSQNNNQNKCENNLVNNINDKKDNKNDINNDDDKNKIKIDNQNDNEFSLKNKLVYFGLKIIKLFFGENVNYLFEVLNYKNENKLGLFDFLEKMKILNEQNIYHLISDFIMAFKFVLENNFNFEFVNLFSKEIIPNLKKSLIRKEKKNTNKFFSKKKTFLDSFNKKSIEILSINSNSNYSFEIEKSNNCSKNKIFSEKKIDLSIQKKKVFSNKKINLLTPITLVKEKKINKNYLYFCLKMINFLFLIKNEKIKESLVKHNIMKFLLKIFEKKQNKENWERSKIFKIHFSTYQKNLLENTKTQDSINFNYEKSFEIIWKILKENYSKKKINILLSITLSILKIINNYQRIEFLKKITFLSEQNKNIKFEILDEIISKTKKTIFIEIDSNLTSESETLQKSEKSFKKIIFKFELEKKNIPKIDLCFSEKKKPRIINLVRSIFEDNLDLDDFDSVLKKRPLPSSS